MGAGKNLSLTLSCLFLVVLSSFGQTNASLVEFRNPGSVPPVKGYSHTSVIDLGNCKMVMISGQVPLDSNGRLVGNGNMAEQAEQAFKNIDNILKAVGGSMKNLVKLGYFVTDMKQIQQVRDARDKFVNLSTPPASTLVEVRKLFRDDVMIEIEATAIIPK